MTERTRRLAAPIAAFLLSLVILGAAAYLTLMPDTRRPGTTSVGGPFSLTAADGRTVTEKDFKGTPFLVFFGFTHCPDICPTKLQEMSQVFDKLGRKGDKVRALFITVDPERDTPQVMKDYVASFNDRIIGLTGSREEIDKVAKAYRVFARKVPLKDGDYTMEHTGLVYLMNREGLFVGSLNLDGPPEKAAQDIVREL